MTEVFIVLGTRPEAIKLFPVYKNLVERKISVKLINTGQHKELLESIFHLTGMKPDIQLDIMEKDQTLIDLSIRLMQKFKNIFVSDKPQYIIVQGDTTSAFIAALAGFYYNIQIVHIEAGLRTYNKFSPYPEEVNRQMISTLTDIHFTPTRNARENLLKEGKKNVFLSGNTVVDSIQLFKEKILINNKKLKFKDFINQKICLITLHRRENFGEKLKNICEAIKTIASRYKDFQFIFPVHLNPNVRKHVFEILNDSQNIHLKEPFQYDELLYILSQSYIILTDSGGIQEEAPSFNVPVIVLRENTERPEGIIAGCSVLGGTNREQIINTFSNIINDDQRYRQMTKTPNPYGDGKASERIVNHLFNFHSH